MIRLFYTLLEEKYLDTVKSIMKEKLSELLRGESRLVSEITSEFGSES